MEVEENHLNSWHEVKKTLCSNPRREDIRFKERQVWWVSVGHNIGDEQYGKGILYTRPVLIIKKISSTMFYGIPVTSKQKKGYYYHLCRYVEDNRGDNLVILSQLRVFDTKRLSHKHGLVETANFEAIRSKMIVIIGGQN